MGPPNRWVGREMSDMREKQTTIAKMNIINKMNSSRRDA